jgi:hypothetical protein
MIRVHMTAERAREILRERGWTVEPVPGGHAYVRPERTLRAAGGRFGVDYLWELDEAITEALGAAVPEEAAEALGL